MRLAGAGRAPGPGVGGVRRLQPHHDRTEWNIQRDADGAARGSAAGAAEPPDSRLYRHLEDRQRDCGNDRREPEKQNGRHENVAANGRPRHRDHFVGEDRSPRVRTPYERGVAAQAGSLESGDQLDGRPAFRCRNAGWRCRRQAAGRRGRRFHAAVRPPEHHVRVRAALANLITVPFKFDTSGGRIVLYQPNGL